MKQEYLSLILSIERLHRRFLDVVKSKLDRKGIEEINNVQTLILYNIGDTVLTIGELTNRGYYLGSNVSYNLKKLVETGYVLQERSPHDKRTIKIRLSDKGVELCKVIDELFDDNLKRIAEFNISKAEIEASFAVMKKIEVFWTDQVSTTY
ncbi:MAG: MarR family transcriptional regulator [Rickettsiales bacterium]|nr:MarR family transcriptional regulator [Rickettsiales bacterium]